MGQTDFTVQIYFHIFRTCDGWLSIDRCADVGFISFPHVTQPNTETNPGFADTCTQESKIHHHSKSTRREQKWKKKGIQRREDRKEEKPKKMEKGSEGRWIDRDFSIFNSTISWIHLFLTKISFKSLH